VFIDRKSNSESDDRMTSLHEEVEHARIALQGRLLEEAWRLRMSKGHLQDGE